MFNKPRPTILLLLLLSLFLSGCIPPSPEPGIGKVLDWQELPGWQQDKHAEAWPALLQQCEVMPKKNPQWKKICLDAALLGEIDNESARRFFETRFTAHQIIPSNKQDGSPGTGLVTGYYEPLLKGSLAPYDPYQYPLYS